MNDFRKYATGHLGMNGMTLDEVMKAQAQYMNPYILEERQLNVTQMDVFSRLMMDRIIFLGTEVNDYTANTLTAQLLYLDSIDSGKDISIYINSPGGSVTAGLAIYDTMQFISSDVATMCTGMAASMAAVLLVAGKEGKRSALTHSRVMIHQPLGGVQGQASDIEIEAREIQKFKKELYNIISDHSQILLSLVLSDDIFVEIFLYLRGLGHVAERHVECGFPAHSLRPEASLHHNLVGLLRTGVADKSVQSGDEQIDVLLASSAEAANFLWHFPFSFSYCFFLVITESIIPYSLASSAVIQ